MYYDSIYNTPNGKMVKFICDKCGKEVIYPYNKKVFNSVGADLCYIASGKGNEIACECGNTCSDGVVGTEKYSKHINQQVMTTDNEESTKNVSTTDATNTTRTSKYKNVCFCLGWCILIIGIICSIYMGGYYHGYFYWDDYNFMTTIIGSIISIISALFFFIFWEILDFLENIYNKLN